MWCEKVQLKQNGITMIKHRVLLVYDHAGPSCCSMEKYYICAAAGVISVSGSCFVEFLLNRGRVLFVIKERRKNNRIHIMLFTFFFGSGPGHYNKISKFN